MTAYELVTIVRPDVATDQVQKVTDKLKDIITKEDGKILKTEEWGLKTFAYRIRKYGRGYYTMLVIEMPGTGLPELERNINLSEDIIRHLIVKLDKVEDGPSPMMRRQDERSSAAA